MKKRIGFSSFPDYSGNSKALYKALLLKDLKEFELVWFVKDIKVKEQLEKLNIKVFCDFEDNFEEEFSKTHIMFITHDNYINIKRDYQIFVGLWHGLGPKKSGALIQTKEAREFIDTYSKSCDYILAPSEFGSIVFSALFNKKVDKILQYPQPRYEFLEKSNGKQNLEKLLKKDLSKFRKIILYAPTFRNGLGERNGQLSNQNLINVNKYKEKEFIDYLLKNNYLLILKMHPSEETKVNIEDGTQNVVILKDELMIKNLISINEILNGIDLLIADYSSIYIDFINLLRPIIFLNTDEEKYIEDRGLIFNSTQFWFPGPKVNNMTNLCDEIDKMFQDENYYKTQRIQFNNLVNESKDLSCDRFIDEFIKDIEVKEDEKEQNKESKKTLISKILNKFK